MFLICRVVGFVLIVLGLYVVLWGKNKEIINDKNIMDIKGIENEE